MHAADTDTVRAMCRCSSRHRSLNFCTLNSFKLCTHQWMCTSSYWGEPHSQASNLASVTRDIFYYYWRALQRIARLCETCMHRTSTRACPSHRRCFCQIELVKRSCWSFPPPEIASLPPFLSCPKTVFSKSPLSL